MNKVPNFDLFCHSVDTARHEKVVCQTTKLIFLGDVYFSPKGRLTEVTIVIRKKSIEAMDRHRQAVPFKPCQLVVLRVHEREKGRFQKLRIYIQEHSGSRKYAK